MRDRVILDLCAGSGAWSQPYKDAGYFVDYVELPDGDVRLLEPYPEPVHGILAAPPCTVFSYARNRYKPTDQELIEALSVVDACLRAVIVNKPKWWALENPINKLRTYLGNPPWSFRRWEFGDEGDKPTGIWGNYNIPFFKPAPRVHRSTFGTHLPNATPEMSVTPAGFAQAFFEANA